MKHIKLPQSDWFYIAICGIIALLALFFYEPTAHGQDIKRISKTTVIVKTDKSHAKQPAVKTQYVVVIDSIAHPVYMNPNSGKMYIFRTSKKTGKQYKVYSIKGIKINQMFNR